MKRIAFFASFFAAIVAANTVEAQTAPEQLTDRARADLPTENSTTWNLSGGAILNTGNTESWAANAGTNYQMVRGRHSFLFETLFSQSSANIRNTDGTETGYRTNARNLNSRLRYDYSFTENDAVYYSVRHRWDTFAGLETRLQNQVGYLRNFIKQEKQRFWGEAGYDLTFDNLYPDPFIDPTTMAAVDGTVLVHAARAYLGYTNHLNEHILFETGGELLFNFQDGKDVRFNYDARLLATLAARLQLELKFRMLIDNVPVPGKEKVDTTTIANIIVTLL